MERVRSTDEEVVITKNGSPAAILISPDEFDSWKETLKIQRDTALLAEIHRGLKELKGKKARVYSLDKLVK